MGHTLRPTPLHPCLPTYARAPKRTVPLRLKTLWGRFFSSHSCLTHSLTWPGSQTDRMRPTVTSCGESGSAWFLHGAEDLSCRSSCEPPPPPPMPVLMPMPMPLSLSPLPPDSGESLLPLPAVPGVPEAPVDDVESSREGGAKVPSEEFLRWLPDDEEEEEERAWRGEAGKRCEAGADEAREGVGGGTMRFQFQRFLDKTCIMPRIDRDITFQVCGREEHGR